MVLLLAKMFTKYFIYWKKQHQKQSGEALVTTELIFWIHEDNFWWA